MQQADDNQPAAFGQRCGDTLIVPSGAGDVKSMLAAACAVLPARATWLLRFWQFAPHWVIDPANQQCYIESSRGAVMRMNGSVIGDETRKIRYETA